MKPPTVKALLAAVAKARSDQKPGVFGIRPRRRISRRAAFSFPFPLDVVLFSCVVSSGPRRGFDSGSGSGGDGDGTGGAGGCVSKWTRRVGGSILILVLVLICLAFPSTHPPRSMNGRQTEREGAAHRGTD